MIRVLSICALGILYQGFALAAAPFNVFGTDDRKAMPSEGYPWRTIGKLRSSKGQCTATLVGKDLILTAAHCIFDKETGELHPTLSFMPGYHQGQYQDSASVIYAWWGTNLTFGPQAIRQEDWAIARIDKPLGDKLGFLGFLDLDPLKQESYDVPLVLPGYSRDFMGGETAGVHEGCHLRSLTANDFFLHDCDMDAGASGAPIFIWSGSEKLYQIVAVNVAHYTTDRHAGDEYTATTANIGVRASRFAKKLEELLAAQ